MMTTLDRRNAERARIPCNIPVELTDPQRAAQFEADAVDLSVGGLSLRTDNLPEMGSQLICSFEAMPGGATVLSRGEVVWRQASEDGGGEFGMRFVEVDPKHQSLIDEMVAERVARIDTLFNSSTPVTASLELENVGAPIAVKLMRSCAGELLFEQALDLLQVGKSMVAHAGSSALRGKLASVQLRMDGDTPTLALSMRLETEPARFGEFDWGPADSDTDPDVFAHGVIADDVHSTDDAPELAPQLTAAPAGEGTLAGLGAPFAVPAPIVARDNDQLPLVFRQSEAPAGRSGSTRLGLGAAQDHEDHDDHDDDDTRVARQDEQTRVVHHHDEPDRVFADEDHALALLTSASIASFESDMHVAPKSSANDDTWAHPMPEDAPHSPLVRALAVFAAASEHVRPWLERGQRSLGQLQLRARGSQRVVAGAGRSATWSRPRRVTAGTNERDIERHSTLRWVAIGAMTIIAVALFVYALAPSSADQVALHRTLEQEHAISPAIDPQLNGSSTLTATAGDEGEPPAPAPAPSAKPTAAQKSVASPGSRSAATLAAATASPSAPEDRYRAPTSQPTAAKSAAKPSAYFGQKQIPNARRFLLRVSGPVRLVQGTPLSDGFTVVVSDVRALDKAAPIAAGHPSVEQAMILNRKDYAELSVRFAPGKHPAYRVTPQGAAIEVLLGP
jgi:hypothetical protein